MRDKLNTPTIPKDYAFWLKKRLDERGKDANRLIFSLVDLVDLEAITEIYEKTCEIEANGGLMTADGNRRRTMGGVFFHLAKQMLPDDVINELFDVSGNSYVKRQRRRRMDWVERFNVVKKIEQQGMICDMKVTLTGRPGDVIKSGSTVIMQMNHEFDYDFPQYPAGIPDANIPPTVYTVYMAEKEWKKVADKLQNSNTLLHINGECHFDSHTQTMAVFSRHVKTEKVKPKKAETPKNDENSVQKPIPKAETVSEASVPKLAKEPTEKVKQPTLPIKPRMIIADFTPAPPLELPDTVPDDVATQAQELHAAINKFQEKIANLKANNQKSGLKMTERLLQNTENQLALLLKPYN